MVKKQCVLASWVGGNDLKAVAGAEAGPILATLNTVSFDSVELLCSYPSELVEPYLAWLRQQVDVPITAHYFSLSSPVHFGEIYQAASQYLKRQFEAFLAERRRLTAQKIKQYYWGL